MRALEVQRERVWCERIGESAEAVTQWMGINRQHRYRRVKWGAAASMLGVQSIGGYAGLYVRVVVKLALDR